MKDIVNMIHASEMRTTVDMIIANATTDTVGMTITSDAATGIGIGHDISSRTTKCSMTAT